MVTPRFLIEAVLKVGSEIELPRTVAHHALRVLRLVDDAEIILFDGRGGQWRARLVTGKKARATVIAFEPIDYESPLALTVLQAWIAVDKLDWVVEKATELGVVRIVLLPTERSLIRLAGDRLQRRLIHLREIAGAACAQCGRNRLPAIAAAPSYAAAIDSSCAAQARLVLSPDADNAMSVPAATRSCALLVGPEGGLTVAELNTAVTSGFVAARLGPRTLRTETAALVAAAILQSTAGDLDLH
jgi:16S rRNA (uracil1498-N3)-methyltransferase